MWFKMKMVNGTVGIRFWIMSVWNGENLGTWLNNTEGMGYARMLRFADEVDQLTRLYYSDPEVQEKHLNDRLEQIGFRMDGARMLGARDPDGKPVKIENLENQRMQELLTAMENR